MPVITTWVDRKVVITGASQGIGRAVSEQLHARGAAIGAIARSRDGLDALAGRLGSRVKTVAADVSRREEVEAAVASLIKSLGGVDVLINCAGIGLYGPAADCDPDEVERLMRTNFFSVVYTTKAVLPSMQQAGSGHIVNVGSVAGRMAAPFEAAYSASKFAVSGYTEALRTELSGSGIGVSLVQPGPVQTDFFKTRGHPYARQSPRPIAAEEVAKAIIFAIERDRFEVIVPRSLGAALVARHLFPALYLPGIRRAFKAELAGLRDGHGLQ